MATTMLFHFDQSLANAYGLPSFSGGVTYFTGKYGDGVTGFDANNYLTTMTDIDTVYGGGNVFTVEMYVKMGGYGGHGQAFDIGSLMSLRLYNDGVNAGADIWAVHNAGTEQSPNYVLGSVATGAIASLLDTSSFHHVALVRNNSNVKLFVDGVLALQANNVTLIVGSPGSTLTAVGNSASQATHGSLPFSGVIDELRVSTESLYTSNFTAPTAPFIGGKMAQQIDKRFIKNGAVDGDKIKILSGQSIKAETTSGTEVELLKVGTDGVVKALGQDIAYKSEVVAEESARIAGDASTLSSAQAYADQKVADLVNSAPATLDTLNELAQALGSDPNFATTVATQIGEIASDLADEVTARTNADSLLQSNIDAEALARANADTALQANIDAEILARTNSDDALQSNIDAEATARANADIALQGNIDAEALARANADTALQAEIDAEEVARADADAILQSAIDAEEVARANADSALQAEIDAEEVARANADSALQSNIDSLDAKVEGEFGFQSVVSSASAVTMTMATRKLEVTGTVAQVIKLPSVATLKVGSVVEIYNRTNTALVVQDATGTVLSVGGAGGSIPSQYQVKYICTAISSANEQTWKFIYSPMRSGTLGLNAGNLPVYGLPTMVDADSGDKAVPKSYLMTKYAELQAQMVGAVNHYKMIFTLTATDITNGYVNLGHTAKLNTVKASLGRLGMFETEDYSLSVEGGVTRLTFGSLIGAGVEAPIAGDKIFVDYAV